MSVSNDLSSNGLMQQLQDSVKGWGLPEYISQEIVLKSLLQTYIEHKECIFKTYCANKSVVFDIEILIYFSLNTISNLLFLARIISPKL